MLNRSSNYLAVYPKPFTERNRHMQKLFSGAIIALLASFTAQATDVLIASRNQGGDHKWIRPWMLVKNTGTADFDLQYRTINYYFYDSDPQLLGKLSTPEIWNCSHGTDGIGFTFSSLSEATGPHGKKANYKCQVSFATSKNILKNTQMELKFGFHKNPYDPAFNEDDDWSYTTNTDYFIPTSAITLIGPLGTVFNGRVPVNLADLLAAAKTNIQYVIVIMQENRSFDHYFGTYPGTDNIPGGKVTVGFKGRQFSTEHLVSPIDQNMPHFTHDATTCITGGIDANGNLLATNFLQAAYNDAPGDDAYWKGALAYHTRTEIPNYWRYADNFVLADRLFASCASWSFPTHLYMISGWSAQCDATGCKSYFPDAQSRFPYGYGSFSWKTIVDVLESRGVDWRYYVAENFDVDNCASCDGPCINAVDNDTYFDIWDPLPNFDNIINNGLTYKIRNRTLAPDLDFAQGLNSFYNDINTNNLKPVSWIVPGAVGSEHAGNYAGRNISVTDGQKYVTTLINKIMNSPAIWPHCAIFLAWDDWGGFYDHVKPPAPDKNGYGLRVPAMLISPFAKKGYVDHQELSFDAYLKFIEDRFLDGERIRGDGRALDGKGSIREEAPNMGDVLYEFDFTQPARAPMTIGCP